MVRHTLQQIGREVRRFRRKHGAGAHLPARLRQAAVDLAASLDAEKITVELAISGETLRRWRLRYPAARISPPRLVAKKTRSTVKARPKKIDFVEIKGTPRQVVQPESPSSAIEVTRPDGSTVRVTGDLAKDLAATLLGKITL